MPYLYTNTSPRKRIRESKGSFTPDGWPECIKVQWSYHVDDGLEVTDVTVLGRSILDQLSQKNINTIGELTAEAILE